MGFHCITFIRSCSLSSTVDTDTSFLDNGSVCSIHHTQDCRVSRAGVVKIKYEDRTAQPPCLKDAQAPLTPETYQSKFYSLLYHEEEVHSKILANRYVLSTRQRASLAFVYKHCYKILEVCTNFCNKYMCVYKGEFSYVGNFS